MDDQIRNKLKEIADILKDNHVSIADIKIKIPHNKEPKIHIDYAKYG